MVRVRVRDRVRARVRMSGGEHLELDAAPHRPAQAVEGAQLEGVATLCEAPLHLVRVRVGVRVRVRVRVS